MDKAVATLERAISLEPQDPTIISHLGDALWQQGRRIEARFRWRQALALEASAEDKRKLQARLDYGLDAAPAMLAQKIHRLRECLQIRKLGWNSTRGGQ